MYRIGMGGLAIVLILGTLTAMGALAEEPSRVDPAKLAAWRADAFGMFIHWGPVSLKGTEIGWSRGREIPIEEYDALYKQFDPAEFDADAWVRIAKAAGMKYVVFTTKHHDGFCMWPSKYTDYDIAAAPFGRDVVGELAAACRKAGLGFGTYHSVCDWYHPDYPKGSPGGKSDKPNPNLPRYIEYLRNQVTELMENYGPLYVMWFDVPREVGPEYGIPTVNMVRKLQPDIIINNRAYKADPEASGAAGKQDNVGDYSTPEQRVGGFDRERPWETCMTICRQWAWKPNDKMKSLEECIQTLLFTVGGDGNLLFNVGPMPDGRIEARQSERLAEMGAWLERAGAGVYGTRGGPYMPGKEWGASTCRGDEIFLYVMHWPEEGPLVLPSPGAKVREAAAPGGGQVAMTQSGDKLSISLDPAYRDPIATLLVLKVEGDALELEPIAVE